MLLLLLLLGFFVVLINYSASTHHSSKLSPKGTISSTQDTKPLADEKDMGEGGRGLKSCLVQSIKLLYGDQVSVKLLGEIAAI